MDNMRIYDKVRAVPKEAQKPIQAGRLKGMTDINPMWRIRTMTEVFGPVGVGWRYEIIKRELLEGASGEIAAFVDINLYIKQDDTWSEAIPGTGGSMFVTKERNGLYTSDECFKKALTDAISVACKALGVGADIYWQNDPTKYNRPAAERQQERKQETKQEEPIQFPVCQRCKKQVLPIQLKDGRILHPLQVEEMSRKKYNACLCGDCMKAVEAEKKERNTNNA